MDFFEKQDKYTARSRLFMVSFIPALLFLAVAFLYLPLNCFILTVSYGIWSGYIIRDGGESGYLTPGARLYY